MVDEQLASDVTNPASIPPDRWTQLRVCRYKLECQAAWFWMIKIKAGQLSRHTGHRKFASCIVKGQYIGIELMFLLS